MKYLVFVLLGIFVVALVLGYMGLCRFLLVDLSSRFSVHDKTEFSRYMASGLKCGMGATVNSKPFSDNKKVWIFGGDVILVDSLQANRVGMDRQRPDYSFGWKWNAPGYLEISLQLSKKELFDDAIDTIFESAGIEKTGDASRNLDKVEFIYETEER